MTPLLKPIAYSKKIFKILQPMERAQVKSLILAEFEMNKKFSVIALENGGQITLSDEKSSAAYFVKNKRNRGELYF